MSGFIGKPIWRIQTFFYYKLGSVDRCLSHVHKTRVWPSSYHVFCVGWLNLHLLHQTRILACIFKRWIRSCSERHNKHVIHILLHVIPFLVIMHTHGKQVFSVCTKPFDRRTVNTLAIVILYLLVVDFQKVYQITWLDAFYIMLTTSFLIVILCLIRCFK